MESEDDETFFVRLKNPSNNVFLGGRRIATVVIIDDELSGSAGSIIGKFEGTDKEVRILVAQPDGRLLVVGSFGLIGGKNRNRLARLNADGTIDESFRRSLYVLTFWR